MDVGAPGGQSGGGADGRAAERGRRRLGVHLAGVRGPVRGGAREGNVFVRDEQGWGTVAHHQDREGVAPRRDPGAGPRAAAEGQAHGPRRAPERRRKPRPHHAHAGRAGVAGGRHGGALLEAGRHAGAAAGAPGHRPGVLPDHRGHRFLEHVPWTEDVVHHQRGPRLHQGPAEPVLALPGPAGRQRLRLHAAKRGERQEEDHSHALELGALRRLWRRWEPRGGGRGLGLRNRGRERPGRLDEQQAVLDQGRGDDEEPARPHRGQQGGPPTGPAGARGRRAAAQQADARAADGLAAGPPRGQQHPGPRVHQPDVLPGREPRLPGAPVVLHLEVRHGAHVDGHHQRPRRRRQPGPARDHLGQPHVGRRRVPAHRRGPPRGLLAHAAAHRRQGGILLRPRRQLEAKVLSMATLGRERLQETAGLLPVG
mmetsp:Transcript_47678/g.123705  ORF Transcript_47678/g.123705 Transcript_47678/m.123705 type:complete len:425 (-) Transcript_47678:1392-2666(-)